MKRTIVVLLAVLGALFAPARALALDAAAKAVVVYVEGPDAEAVRSELVAAVNDRVRVIDVKVFADAIFREGQRGPFGPVLTIAKQRERATTRIRKAAAAIGADAVIVGRTKKVGPNASVWLLFIDQIPGDLAVDEEVALRGDPAARTGALRAALARQLDELAPPKKEEPKPDLPPPPPAAPVATRTVNEMGTSLVNATLLFEVGGRRFAYTDAISPNLRGYDVFGVPVPAIAAEVYPLANTTIPVVRDLGLTASFAHAFALESATKSGDVISTQWYRFEGGLRYRFRFTDDAGPMIGLRGSFGLLRFGFEAPGTLAGEVPDVSYKYLRVGLDGRIPFWRMAALLDVGYDGPLDSGEVYDRFKDPSVGGVDFGVGLAFKIAAGFEARIAARYTRWFYAFGPEPGDTYIAGGALDELLNLGAGVAYAY